ncbi:MAG: LysM peptidoglycan-binding domain-containing protein [Propioniciclava sp.]
MIGRFLAWVALVVLVAVPPVLLSGLGFYEWRVLSLTNITDVRILLAFLTLVGWLAWGGWLLALTTEVIALRRQRPRRPLPGLRWSQVLAGSLLAAAVASGVTGPAMATPTEPPISGASFAPDSDPDVPTGQPSGDPESSPDAPSASAQPGGLVHVIQRGDDLWSLAERYYADGRAWRQIVTANPHLQQDPTADLEVGHRLAITNPVRLITVRRGDTLSELARTYLGDGHRWPELHRLNRETVTDPDVIDVGWVLKVPMLAPDAPGGPESTPMVAGDGEDAQIDGNSSPVPTEADPPANGAGANPQDRTRVSPAPASPSEPPAPYSGRPDGGVEASSTAVDPAALTGVLGGLGSVAAAAIVGGLALRRRLRAPSRPVGRRFLAPGAEPAHVETALHVSAGTTEPGREHLLGRAMRYLSAHWHQTDCPAPAVDEVLLGEAEVSFQFAADPGTPPHFLRLGNRLTIAWRRLNALPESSAPVAYPALVTLGEDSAGQLVMTDLITSAAVGIRGGDNQVRSEMLSAMLLELACTPWASEVSVLVVTAEATFAEAVGGDQVRCTPDATTAMAELQRWRDERTRELGGRSWDRVRLDPDLAEAWAPRVVVVETALSDHDVAQFATLAESSHCGVAVVLPVGVEAGLATWEIAEPAHGPTVQTAAREGLTPQTLPATTRAAIGQLYSQAESATTERAPWWADDTEEPVNIIELHPTPPPSLAGPCVRLLGPIELMGAAGEPPTRAMRQCVEYCAWLLEHPGGTPSEMVAELFVSDATRRSNLSRLRSWLGATPDGQPYLPDAYSGRINLHADVTSDWQELRQLTSLGISRISLDRMKLALQMFRGAPLADAAPGQWGWAEELRADMSALGRDLGVSAARLARQQGDLEGSRWAANRALVAAPDDELLLGERIRTEKASGRLDEVDRLTRRVHRRARSLGVDLLPETVDLLQEVLEGRLRVRQAQ